MRFKNFHHQLKKEFEEYPTLEEAKRNPSKDLRHKQAKWESLCDYFSSEAFKSESKDDYDESRLIKSKGDDDYGYSFSGIHKSMRVTMAELCSV
ncbi:hypothetical protein WN943_003474 [Citrus x changshan-huyou]